MGDLEGGSRASAERPMSLRSLKHNNFRGVLRMPGRILLVWALILCQAAPATAQRVARDLPSYRLQLDELAPGHGQRGEFSWDRNGRDYRWEGLAIGAAVLGIAGAVVGHELCSESDAAQRGSCAGATVGAGLVGAALGAVVGVILGARIKKGTQVCAFPRMTGLYGLDLASAGFPREESPTVRLVAGRPGYRSRLTACARSLLPGSAPPVRSAPSPRGAPRA